MVLDSSAIIAILLDEPEAHRLAAKITGADTLAVSAATLLETAIVLESRLGELARPALDAFVRDLNCTVLSFTEAHYVEARTAYSRFGKGRHRAALNFGDCMTYATAKMEKEPLLFVGADFGQTDVLAA